MNPTLAGEVFNVDFPEIAQASAVPEPSTLVLVAVGLLMAGGRFDFVFRWQGRSNFFFVSWGPGVRTLFFVSGRPKPGSGGPV